MSAELEAVLPAFGFGSGARVESLYAYAPVFRVRERGLDVVLKGTGRAYSSGEAVARWTRELAGRGLGVVSPVEGLTPNPRSLPTGPGGAPQSWVAYPFVAGEPYTGGEGQLRAAGRLLGELHAAEVPSARALATFEEGPKHPPGKVRALLDAAGAAFAQFAPEYLDCWRARVEGVEDADLTQGDPGVLVGASFDYKASNLVFREGGWPVLVDPDHAARLPRAFDLATALLLFELDTPHSPGALWSPGAWRTFRNAYFGRVTWTPGEWAGWPEVVRAAWVYHVPWLLAHWPEGWQDARERTWLLSAALVDLEPYGL